MMASNSIEKIYKKRIKLGGYIDLNPFASSKESSYVYGSNARCWFKFDNGRILFKAYENDLEAYGEVLYSSIANKHKVNCPRYDFATFKTGREEEYGTISYDLAYGEDKIAIDGLTLFARYGDDRMPDLLKNRGHNLELVKMFNKKYNNYEEFTKLFERRYPDDVKALQKELIRMFVLDVLLDNVDKNLWNIIIVTDSYGNNPHLYSIDSSHIACLYRGEEFIKNTISNLLVSDGSVTIKDYLSGGCYGYDVDVKDNNYDPCRDLLDFYKNSDEETRNEIQELIKEIDINEEIEIINKIHKVDSRVNDWICAVFNTRKAYLLKKFYHINDNYREDGKKKNFRLKIKR